jgi:hypothetical protein
MADEILPSLKAADINIAKCANRAKQLRSAEPVVAYWCETWPRYSLPIDLILTR